MRGTTDARYATLANDGMPSTDRGYFATKLTVALEIAREARERRLERHCRRLAARLQYVEQRVFVSAADLEARAVLEDDLGVAAVLDLELADLAEADEARAVHATEAVRRQALLHVAHRFAHEYCCLPVWIVT